MGVPSCMGMGEIGLRRWGCRSSPPKEGGGSRKGALVTGQSQEAKTFDDDSPTAPRSGLEEFFSKKNFPMIHISK